MSCVPWSGSIMKGVLNKFKSMFRQDLSIDLGTANTLIYAKGHGIVLNEPSVVAVRNEYDRGHKVLAVGSEAKRMLGRTPGNILAVRPMQAGVIADFNITEKMLQYFVRQVRRVGFLPLGSRILIGVPCGATQVERRAIREAALGAGASEVFLITEAMAAAIGAGLPIEQANGCMVVDIGGGTADVAILSLNGVVYSESVRVGGDRFDEAVMSYVRRRFGTLIGDATAERIKLGVGCAFPNDDVKEIEVKGRNLSAGLPKSFVVSSRDFLEAVQDPLSAITHAVHNALEQTPPELAADVAERGIVLAGGGALLPHMDQLLKQETGLPVFVADEPLDCVVRGAGMALEMLDDYDGCLDFLLEE